MSSFLQEPFVDLIYFDRHGDDRGSLTAIENGKQIPFDIQRIYYIYETQADAIRGKHAHNNLKQVLICVSGSCEVQIEFQGTQKTFLLDSPTEGLYIQGKVWREMKNFSAGAVLLVLADAPYDKNDYIFSYQDFKQSHPPVIENHPPKYRECTF
jgi:dTDP-4-dehydrorhamnose 3,5-epimerase-like enzyme